MGIGSALRARRGWRTARWYANPLVRPTSLASMTTRGLDKNWCDKTKKVNKTLKSQESRGHARARKCELKLILFFWKPLRGHCDDQKVRADIFRTHNETRERTSVTFIDPSSHRVILIKDHFIARRKR